MDHFRDHFIKSIFWLPAKFFFCFRSVAIKCVHFGGPKVPWMYANNLFSYRHVIFWIIAMANKTFLVGATTRKVKLDPQLSKRSYHKFSHGNALPGCDHKIFWLFQLQHSPHS